MKIESSLLERGHNMSVKYQTIYKTVQPLKVCVETGLNVKEPFLLIFKVLLKNPLGFFLTM